MHFFTEQDLTDETQAVLSGGSAHHLIHVLRARTGDRIELSDGCGRTYACTLKEVSEGQAKLSVDSEIQESRELPAQITLYQGLPKGDKMALIIQKAVELGADRIVPVLMERSVARPDAKAAAHKRQRWQKIAEAAAKQCGRDVIARVQPVCSFDEAVRKASEEKHFILPYECAGDMEYTRRRISQIRMVCGRSMRSRRYCAVSRVWTGRRKSIWRRPGAMPICMPAGRGSDG